MGQKYWHIQGFDGLNTIYDQKIKAGCISTNEIENLLKVLVAKAGLNYDEIIGAYAKKGTKIRNELLSVKRDGPYQIYNCGVGPNFMARIIDE